MNEYWRKVSKIQATMAAMGALGKKKLWPMCAGKNEEILCKIIFKDQETITLP